MTTLDHSTCSLTGTVSSRLIVGVHLEVSHRRLNRPLEEMVLVFTAHLKAHQHPGHYVGSVYGYGWGSPGRCYQNGSGQDGSGGGGGSSSSMNGMPVFDQYVNRYFINQIVCPAFVTIFKVIINHGSLSNLTMVWFDKPKQPRSQEVKKKGTHTHTDSI
ncbi:unnamed protein product [Brassica oleracea]